jgi:4-hydroxy-tetrahydrodipicolinate synthase
LHYKVFDLIQLLFADGNPGGIKETLQHMGIIYNEMRQPLYPVNKEVSKKISEFINQF